MRRFNDGRRRGSPQLAKPTHDHRSVRARAAPCGAQRDTTSRAKAAAGAEHGVRQASITAVAPGRARQREAPQYISCGNGRASRWIAGNIGTVELTPAQRAEIARITAAMAAIGPCLPGSVTTRIGTCGKEACSCKADPPRLHGPYRSWTRKVATKTVTWHLSEEQMREYQPYFDNARNLRALLAELEAVTLAIVEADPRWDTPARLRTSGAVDKVWSQSR
jgi:hypothetical protein